ncbi:hypothetical protein GCM10022248_77650 [Nonomuraea soli]
MQQGDLPAELTTFVGRRAELKEVKRLLGRARLVTLTGPGGVGKTRLALKAAHAVRRAFEDGAFFVDLSDVRAPEMLDRALVTCLRLVDQTARPACEVLHAHLADKRVLLVLDGVEHLVEECEALLGPLLKAAAGLSVLVTSRQVLEADGEHVVVVPPMSAGDAVSLFADRAGDASLGRGQTELVRQLCLRLDLLPLAIELAAVRLRVMCLEEVVIQLLPLDLGNRNTTLRTVIGWSHELCTPHERLLWARLSVFCGSFALEAAEAVCSDSCLPAVEIADVVGGLVDKSILSAEETAGGLRFRMLDSIKDYGAEWLARLDSQSERLERRHKDFYLAQARTSAAAWFGPDQQRIFVRTRAQLDNLRGAFERCEVDEALELASTLWFYWVGCGQLGEGWTWLGRALARGGSTGPRARALWVAGYVAVLIGEFSRAREMLEECRALEDPATKAYAVHRLGCLALVSDDHDRAVELFNEAVEHYAANRTLECNVLMACVELALVMAFQQQVEACHELCDQVRESCESVGELWVRSYVDYVEAYTAWLTGDGDLALTLSLRSLQVSHHFHDLFCTVLVIEFVALLRAESGDVERAAVLQGAAARIWESVGPRLLDSSYFNAAHVACAELSRKALGRHAYAGAHTRGTRLDLDAAVAVAMGAAETRQELPLTPREWEVAELVSLGLSNREAAGRLTISKRTVDTHVEHILAKLGFSTRAQIATWVTEQQDESAR